MCKSAFPRLAQLRHRLSRGFTLIELMVTVAVLAILSALAMPSMIRLIDNSRVSGAVSEYVAAINLARSEAVRRGSRVTICAAQSPTVCKAGAGDWTAGYIVFADDGPAPGDPGTPGTLDAGEEVIKQRGEWAGVATVVGSATVRRVSYLASGRLEVGTMIGTVAFTPSTSQEQRYVCIDRSGRPRVDEMPCV